ncbi:MAG: carbohydrate binding domain-containing protein, partial [Nocardioidaceae bacterium]
GPVWTYRGLDLPFPIKVGGEVMTVDLIGDVLNINPYFATDVSDWSVQTATSIAHSTAVVHPSGVGSMLITPNGSSASGGAQTALTGVGTVTTGRSYIASAWVNVPTGHSDIRTAIDWYDSSGAFLSSDLDGQFSAAAGVWTPLTATLVAPASASQARMRIRLGGTPPATALTYVWNAQLIDVTDSSSSPQQMRVTRNVNGVVKSQSAGAAVSLADPTVYAL